MITVVAALVVFSILIVVHELGHLLAAKAAGVKVEKFSLGFGKKIFSIKKGDTEYALSAFLFGGYVKLAGSDPVECKGAADEFLSKSPLKRFSIVVAGSVTNYIFAFFLFASIFIIGFPTRAPLVGKMLPDYPAAESGLKEGDRIASIDKKNIKYWHELVDIVEKKTSDVPMRLDVERSGKMLTLEIIPKIITGKNIFGQKTSVGKIGVMPEKEIILQRHGFFEGIVLGGKELIKMTALTYRGLWLLVTGGIPFAESAMGPIGIAVIIGQAAKAGLVSILFTMAHINLALAIFNLLPIPALDGGHVIFLGIEKLRGKPVSPKMQEGISQIALYALIALIIFISWNDINRFFPFMKR